MKKAFLAILVLASNPSYALDCPISLLPTTTPVQAKLMQLGLPTNVQELWGRLRAALNSQPDWARQYIAANDRPGQPLPYHPNLQVTPDEYRTMLATRWGLVQVGSALLIAEPFSDGQVRLKVDSTQSKLNGFTIGKDCSMASIEGLALTEASVINNQDSSSATGRWLGTQWLYSSFTKDSGQGLMLKFAVGKRIDFGDGIIYLDVKKATGGSVGEHSEVLLFPLSR